MIDLSLAGVLGVALGSALAQLIAIAGGLYWALAKEKLVTGAQHTRELVALAKVVERTEAEHGAELERLRGEHADELHRMREDKAETIARVLRERTVQLDRKDADQARRESELQRTIERTDAEKERVWAALKITRDALAELTDARITAGGEMMTTVLEALRHSPLADRLPELEARQDATGDDG